MRYIDSGNNDGSWIDTQTGKIGYGPKPAGSISDYVSLYGHTQDGTPLYALGTGAQNQYAILTPEQLSQTTMGADGNFIMPAGVPQIHQEPASDGSLWSQGGLRDLVRFGATAAGGYGLASGLGGLGAVPADASWAASPEAVGGYSPSAGALYGGPASYTYSLDAGGGGPSSFSIAQTPAGEQFSMGNAPGSGLPMSQSDIGGMVRTGMGAAGAASGISGTTGGMFGSYGPLASILGPAIGGALGLTAANRAAGAQQGAAGNANALLQSSLDRSLAAQQAGQVASIDELRRQYDTTRADLAPWRAAGTNALAAMQAGLAPGGEFSRGYGLTYNAPAPFQYQDFTFNNDDPSYQFRLSEGLKALQRNRGAAGIFQSGATGKALQDYGQQAASQEYQNAFNRYQAGRQQAANEYGLNANTGLNAFNANYNVWNTDTGNRFNRLSALAGTGQSAVNAGIGANPGANIAGIYNTGANNAASLISGTGNQLSGNLINSGNVAGASGIAGMNAISNAIGQIGNNYNSNALLSYLQNRDMQNQSQPRLTSYGRE